MLWGTVGSAPGASSHCTGVIRTGGIHHTYADPRMLEGLVGCDALGRVDGQHLIDEVFRFGGDCVPLR